MKSRFQDIGAALRAALAAQPGGVEARVAEEEALMRAAQEGLLAAGLRALTPLLVSAHRANPRQGLRGSELVVVTANHAAAARLRLAGPAILARCQAHGLAIQSVKVRALKATAAPPRPIAEARPTIPAAARARLLALIRD